MKKLIVALVILLPVALVAQQTDSSPTKKLLGLAAPLPLNPSSSINGTPPSSAAESEAGDTLASQTSTHSTKTRATRKPSRPRSEGSMVGYVDDAIVASQIRLRFDAGFHDNAPDRAEFFYGQYAGLDGPGPKSVVADLNFQQLYVRGEYASNQRLSFFAELPVRWIQPQLIVANLTPTSTFTSQVGFSDIATGFKLAAIASPSQYLTFQFQAHLPSGNASSGLGTGHSTVEPALLYYRRLSDKVTLEAETGDSHPIGGSSCRNPCESTNLTGPKSQGFAGDVFFYGVGPSYAAYRSQQVLIAPVIELVGWRVLGGLETICVAGVLDCADQVAVTADSTNMVNLKAGVRAMVGDHSSFYVGYGHQLTHEFWYKEILRAEYRYTF
jgi:outer membrane putative beta-barrel porin/alpha-amylase